MLRSAKCSLGLSPQNSWRVRLCTRKGTLWGAFSLCISSIRDDAARRPGGTADVQALSMAMGPMLRAFKSAALARAPLADLLAHAPGPWLTPFGRLLKFALLFERWVRDRLAPRTAEGLRLGLIRYFGSDSLRSPNAEALLGWGSNSLCSLNEAVDALLESFCWGTQMCLLQNSRLVRTLFW